MSGYELLREAGHLALDVTDRAVGALDCCSDLVELLELVLWLEVVVGEDSGALLIQKVFLDLLDGLVAGLCDSADLCNGGSGSLVDGGGYELPLLVHSGCPRVSLSVGRVSEALERALGVEAASLLVEIIQQMPDDGMVDLLLVFEGFPG